MYKYMCNYIYASYKPMKKEKHEVMEQALSMGG